MCSESFPKEAPAGGHVERGSGCGAGEALGAGPVSPSVWGGGSPPQCGLSPLWGGDVFPPVWGSGSPSAGRVPLSAGQVSSGPFTRGSCPSTVQRWGVCDVAEAGMEVWRAAEGSWDATGEAPSGRT